MRNKEFDIAIILVNFHSVEDTSHCLESIVQNDQVNAFFIVVDNSQPNERKLDDLKYKIDDLEILYSKSNEGFAKANNAGVEWAKNNIDFKYLLFLNNDTVIEPFAISKLIDALQNRPDIDIATCKITYFTDNDKIWYGGGTIDFKRGWPIIDEHNMDGMSDLVNKSRIVEYASGCVLLLTKKALNLLKGFDERFFMYVEDLELCVRAKEENLMIWYEAGATIQHKVGGSQKESDHSGMHPKNPNVAFHFYHKYLNRWIAFTSHLRGRDLKAFKFYFWKSFILKVMQLLILSPYRKSVYSSMMKVIKEKNKWK